MKIFYDQQKCLACKTCEIACALEHSKENSLLKLFLSGELPKPRIELKSTLDFSPFVVNCRQCEPAPCVQACISRALYKQDSETKFDEEKCVACWMCIMVCPFGAVRRTAQEGKEIPSKCDLCPEREDYACVSSCPSKALSAGE